MTKGNSRSEPIITSAESNQFKLYRRYPVAIESGSGSVVVDADGREYIDALSGIAVNSVGHCHPAVVKAIQEQAERLIHVSNFYYSEPQSRLGALLAEMSGYDRVFFCNSGAEALEAAVKMGRKNGNLKGKGGGLVALENCFHGRTIGTISLGKEKYRASFEPMPPDIERVEPNNVEALEKVVNDGTGAVIMEPIQGEGGVKPLDRGYLEAARKICDRHNVLLVFDEVQCGIARTGHLFAWMYYGVKPDVVCSAKALGGGFPIGAVLATEEAASILDYGEHGTTYGGNPLACAAALANMEVIRDEKLCDAAAEKGEYLMKTLRDRTAGLEYVLEVRGIGLMVGVELTFKGGPVVKRMMSKGVLANCASETVMRLVPPLVISREEIDTVVDVMLSSMKEEYAATQEKNSA
ncbi:MAG: aspartate aminotransferase family protein [Balneolaceae bacterium]